MYVKHSDCYSLVSKDGLTASSTYLTRFPAEESAIDAGPVFWAYLAKKQRH